MKKYKDSDIVKSCSRIESGLRLAYDGVRACTFSTGAVEAPNYWDANSVPKDLTKSMIIEKRKWLFERLNDPTDDGILCRKCTHWVEKPFKEVRFDRLEFVNVAHFSACNLRCNYCGFTKENHFFKEKYSALHILEKFDRDDITFEASVDFNAGEPTLMRDLDEHLSFFKKNNMRVRLYSNGVIYSQAVYDAIVDGTITWLIISVDAGTPSTYLKTKKADQYNQVIKNLAKYREAEVFGEGKVAAKYIFTADTLSDDDIHGFIYSMISIGVSNIWLLYDYFLFHKDNLDDQKYMIKAYVKMYVEFLKWGKIPFHFADGAAGDVIPLAKKFMDETKELINLEVHKIGKPEKDSNKNKAFDFKDIKIVRENNKGNYKHKRYGLTDIKQAIYENQLDRSRSIVVPVGVATLNLLDNNLLDKINIVALADLSKTKQGRYINNVEVKSYKNLLNVDFDNIVITSDYFKNAILEDIERALGDKFIEKNVILISDEKLDRRS